MVEQPLRVLPACRNGAPAAVKTEVTAWRRRGQREAWMAAWVVSGVAEKATEYVRGMLRVADGDRSGGGGGYVGGVLDTEMGREVETMGRVGGALRVPMGRTGDGAGEDVETRLIGGTGGVEERIEGVANGGDEVAEMGGMISSDVGGDDEVRDGVDGRTTGGRTGSVEEIGDDSGGAGG